MNTKHTPGPWHKGKHCTVYDQLGRRIANSFEGVMVIQISDAECEANACLIAAAPELLEALKSALAVGQIVGGSKDVARAAIAKAEVSA